MTFPYDQITVKVRALNWGWFGKPWPSGVCYNDDDTVNWDMEKRTPLGEKCLWCNEVFVDGDQGSAIPCQEEDGVVIRHQHKECSLRQVMGSYRHLEGDCPGDGTCNHATSTMSLREDALAVWNWVQVHGVQ